MIVDECHHVSAPRFEMVLNEVRARYVLGLTATPERQDGHQKIIFMAAGPIRHKVKRSSDEKFEQEVQIHQFYDTPPLHLSQPEERPRITDTYRWIMENEARTRRITSDVIDSVHENRHPIVLTERREHAKMINNLLKENGIDSIILKGAMKAAERKRVEEHLHSAQVVVATGKYAGRIHRESDGKTQVTIHDYVDCGLPMLQRMFHKREKSYKSMGYTILFSGESACTDSAKQFDAVLV